MVVSVNTDECPADVKSVKAQVCVNMEDGLPYAKSVEVCVNTEECAADARSVVCH